MNAQLKKLFPEVENVDLLKHQQVTRLDLLNAINWLVRELNTIQKEEPTKRWLRSKEVIKLLKISPGTLQNLRINGTLTYTKIGGTLYYDNSDIEKLLNNNKTIATATLFK